MYKSTMNLGKTWMVQIFWKKLKMGKEDNNLKKSNISMLKKVIKKKNYF